MRVRLHRLGLVLAAVGLFFLAGGGVAWLQIQDGYTSLQKFSEVQNVTLSYDEEGRLTDRGTTEEAEAILALLRDDWGYPVDEGELDPADPLVNTDTEYMFQMATIVHHVIDGTVEVTLDEPVEYEGETFAAGTYEVPVDGRYWTDFDRMHPLEGPARSEAWTGTVHGLVGELGVGTVTHSALQLGLGLAAILGGIGATLLLAGFGLVWAARGTDDRTAVAATPAIRERETAPA